MSQLIKHPGAGGPFGIPAEQALVRATALEGGEESFSPRQYLDILRRRKWLVLATPVLVAGLVALNLTTITPLYRSTAQLQIDPELRLDRFSAIQSPRAGGDAHLNTELIKLRSPALAGRVIEELDLVNNEGFARPVRQGLFQEVLGTAMVRVKRLLKGQLRVSAPSSNSSMSEPAAMSRLRENLVARQIRGTKLIAVSFQSPDREVAATVANAMAEAFVAEQLNNRYAALARASSYLEKQLGEVRLQMTESTRRLAEDERGREVLLEGEFDMGRQKLEQLNQVLAAAEAREIELEARYESSLQAGIDTLPDAAKDASYRSIEANYVELEQRLSQLLGRYGPQWPAVRDVRSEIEQIELQLRAQKELALRRTRGELERARASTARLRGEIEAHRRQAAALAKDALEVDLMSQEAQLNRKIYDDLLGRLKEAWAAEGLASANIRFIEPARRAASQFSPNKTRSLTMGLILGLSLGVVLAFVRELTDNTLKSSEDVTRYLDLPALGIVPTLGQEEKRGLRRWLPGGRRRRATSGPLLIEMGPGGADLPALEAYRSLRTAILLSHPANPPQTILVTSAMPGEGKSTTALNVASSLAQAGRRTLLIELDLRKPGLQEALSVRVDQGVTGYLSGNCNLNSQILATYLPDLYFVGCGMVPPNPPELLGSEKMQKGLDLVQQYFTHVVIDSPPILGLSDTLLLARQTDGAVLVARGGKTPRNAVRKAAALFAGVGAKLLGVLVNDLDVTAPGYGYGYGYGYGGYRYGSVYGGRDSQKPPTSSESAAS